jgi:hypothetical protein
MTFIEGEDCREISFWLQELTSAENFESHINALGGLYPYSLWRARRLLLEQKYLEALHDFELCGRQGYFRDARFEGSIIADMAYCQAMLGNKKLAADWIDLFSRASWSAADSDDEAVAFSMGAKVCEFLGRVDEAAILRANADRAGKEDRIRLTSLRGVLAEIGYDGGMLMRE